MTVNVGGDNEGGKFFIDVVMVIVGSGETGYCFDTFYLIICFCGEKEGNENYRRKEVYQPFLFYIEGKGKKSIF